MSNYTEVYLHITVNSGRNAPEKQQGLSGKQSCCELLLTCQNPYCFKHGCINAVRQQAKGGVA